MSDIRDTDYKYALKCIYNAHSSDVRVVKALSNSGGFLTGSRDSTVKLWVPDGKSFKESQTFIGGTTFISSLCILPESSVYPKGLILAGSNDWAIYGFSPDFPEPILKLMEHSGPVCSLTYGGNEYFVSGSWDKTARIWSENVCVSVLEGHKETVWATAIFPSQKTILTGSADKTIRLWGPGGVCEKTFTGHEDCVRGLVIISDAKFVSCGNDNTVRIWLTNGDCTNILKQHSDYIYSITLLDNGIDFATCGEDQTIRIWKDGICAQTVVVPSKSLWSVACLDGDLAIGTSDGKVYVLEKVSVDYFEKAAVTAKEHHVNPPSSMIGEDSDIRSSIYNGEKLVFYECDNIMYVCEYNNESGTNVKKEAFDLNFIHNTFYKKVPEESMSQISSKDKNNYVLEIDIQGMKYNLSFKKEENPWEVAQKFVSDHNLMTEHVGQIVDFIIRNTPSSSVDCNEHFPVRYYNFYQTVYIAGLEGKLIEFSARVPKEVSISEAEIKDLVKLVNFPDTVSNEQLASLDKVVLWDDEFLFPVLDLLRICVKCKVLEAKFASKEFINYILRIFKETKSSINRSLVAKMMCNMFGIQAMEDLLVQYQEKILFSINEAIQCFNEEGIQKSCSMLFLNFSVAKGKGVDVDTFIFCMNLLTALDKFVDPDAIYRLLSAVGTICTNDVVALTYFDPKIVNDLIRKFESYHGNFKVESVAKLLHSKFTYYQF